MYCGYKLKNLVFKQKLTNEKTSVFDPEWGG